MLAHAQGVAGPACRGSGPTAAATHLLIHRGKVCNPVRDKELARVNGVQPSCLPLPDGPPSGIIPEPLLYYSRVRKPPCALYPAPRAVRPDDGALRGRRRQASAKEEGQDDVRI